MKYSIPCLLLILQIHMPITCAAFSPEQERERLELGMNEEDYAQLIAWQQEPAQNGEEIMNDELLAEALEWRETPIQNTPTSYHSTHNKPQAGPSQQKEPLLTREEHAKRAQQYLDRFNNKR